LGIFNQGQISGSPRSPRRSSSISSSGIRQLTSVPEPQ
jgi:hypothetical protein